MSRSPANQQYMVGIPRDSEMNAFYQQEAAEHGLKVPTYLYLLLKDRYEALQGKGQGKWFPRGISLAPAPVYEQRLEESTISADEALGFFGGIDEDDEPTERMPVVRSA